ncbi:MAG: hypothetical protein JW904_05455 [Spirochaetales bacterium]|nr:hypothetical protein [Spirochaetales bacterium]
MKQKMKLNLKLLAAAIVLAVSGILGLSCSDNPPAILENEWRLTLFQNRILGVTYQKLSVFIRAEDKDGTDDLAAMHVINDDAELVWTFEAENWESVQKRGNPWVGTNSIVMPDSSPFPIGLYRVLLEDKSGKIVETSFFLKRQNIETKSARMPSAAVRGDTISVVGTADSAELWIYDANDNFLFSLPVQQMQLPLATITSKNAELNSGFSYYISGKDQDGYYYYTNGPYYYSPEQ